MKAVVQRVTRASVTVGGEQISAIGRGICVLLGISLEDTQKELEHMVRKILNLRVFEDESGKHWSKSVMDKQYEVLCISQFTLQCVLKGNKPDFHLAMPTEQAESFYNSFLEQLRKTYRPELIKDGKFGTYMQVHIQNDGPVTIELESPAPGAATSDPKQMRLSASQRSHQMALTVLHLPLTTDAWVAQRLSACLPSAQRVILESLDRVSHRAPCMEPASLSACVSASLSLCVSHE
ncbi:D-aminoacyl-tRNA deacylase 1 isoform 2-T2 [Lycaon pictus]